MIPLLYDSTEINMLNLIKEILNFVWNDFYFVSNVYLVPKEYMPLMYTYKPNEKFWYIHIYTMSSDLCFKCLISNVTDPLVVWFFSKVACHQHLLVTYIVKWLILWSINPLPTHWIHKMCICFIYCTCNSFLQRFFFLIQCLCLYTSWFFVLLRLNHLLVINNIYKLFKCNIFFLMMHHFEFLRSSSLNQRQLLILKQCSYLYFL